MGRGRSVVDWTPETVGRVKRLILNDHLSASGVVRTLSGEFPGLTRNAVLGKMHRLGLPGGSGICVQPPNRRRKPRAPRPISLKPTEPARRVDQGVRRRSAKRARRRVERDLPAPDMLGLTVADLTPHTCRWPLGDPADLETFSYCGVWAEEKRSYCPHHCGLAYAPARAAA